MHGNPSFLPILAVLLFCACHGRTSASRISPSGQVSLLYGDALDIFAPTPEQTRHASVSHNGFLSGACLHPRISPNPN
jgi:hypothetical protein